MVIAAVLMLYMSGWMYLKQDPKAWMGELRRSAERALDSGATISLGLIAFLAVFREGGETVLFLHALAKTSGGWSFGLIAGLVVAARVPGRDLLRDAEARADAAAAPGVPGHLGVPVHHGAALRRRRDPGVAGADGGALHRRADPALARAARRQSHLGGDRRAARDRGNRGGQHAGVTNAPAAASAPRRRSRAPDHGATANSQHREQDEQRPDAALGPAEGFHARGRRSRAAPRHMGRPDAGDEGADGVEVVQQEPHGGLRAMLRLFCAADGLPLHLVGRGGCRVQAASVCGLCAFSSG